MYNSYRDAEPHEGYYDLLKILDSTKPNRNWFVYHEGTDLLYERAEFPENKIMQGKGNLFYWQCKPCNTIIRNASKKYHHLIIL